MMSQKERNKEETVALSETFVNACWHPYETLQSHLSAELQKQDEILRQSWKITSQYLGEQREKAQQLYQEATSKNVYLTQSDAMKNIAEQTQAIIKTPFDFTLNLIEKADKERSERIQVMANLHDPFISTIKQNQLALLRLSEKNLQKISGV